VLSDRPRRVAKVLLTQPRGDDGTIRSALSQENLPIRPHAPGKTSTPRCAVSSDGDGLRCDLAVTIKQNAALGCFASHEVSAS